MTDVELTRPPAFARSDTSGEWIASRYDDARAILADDRFGVPEAGPPGPVGTVSWLRASVPAQPRPFLHRSAQPRPFL
jgi:hypothetical protein